MAVDNQWKRGRSFLEPLNWLTTPIHSEKLVIVSSPCESLLPGRDWQDFSWIEQPQPRVGTLNEMAIGSREISDWNLVPRGVDILRFERGL
jgi:hypothetical protein